MAYQILTATSLVGFLQQLKVMRQLFGDCSGLEVEALTEGSINLVFRVMQRSSGRSVIVKQAIPFIRSVGEGYPLDRHRMEIEISALQMASQVAPKMVPHVYYSSVEQSVMILQDLSNCQMLNSAILAGVPLPCLSEQLSSFLANTHFAYSALCLSGEQKRSKVSDFTNTQLCKLMMEVMFESPYIDADGNAVSEYLPTSVVNSIRQEQQVLARVAGLKHKYLTLEQSLLHGDLHAGSIMVSAKQTYVIDPEFAFYGPIGFDIGCIIGNLYMFHFLHKNNAYDSCSSAYGDWLLECIDDLWQQFSAKFYQLWLANKKQTSTCGEDLRVNAVFDGCAKQFLAQVKADTFAFAGVKLIRRVLGRDNLGYFSRMKCQKHRAEVEIQVLNFAKSLLLEKSG